MLGESHAWILYEECQVRMDTGVPDLTIHVDLIRQGDQEFPCLGRGWTACTSEEYFEMREAVIAQLEDPVLAFGKTGLIE